MPRSNAMTMSFPPFTGVVRRLILLNVAVFFVIAVLEWVAPQFISMLVLHLELYPLGVLHGEIWQLVTYSFINDGVLNVLFAMLTLWFCGPMLEGAYGTRWFTELYFSSVIGGALLAAALSFTHLLSLSPSDLGSGAWAGLFGVLVAVAMRFGEEEFLLWFVVRIRAKYMVAIYIVVYLAMLIKGANEFAALLVLSGALAGYLYVKFAPRRGMAFGATEQIYGMRNAWYRAKRRRAARKFEVYMSKQGRKVRFDEDGRYVDPDTGRRENGAPPRDPNDRRWMN